MKTLVTETSVILKNIIIDLTGIMTEGVDTRLTAADILPVVAAPITRFDFKSSGKVLDELYYEVRDLLRKKILAFSSYSKEATVEALQDRWVSGLDAEYMQQLLKPIKLIESFDSEGYAVFNKTLYDAYAKLTISPETLIDYGRAAFSQGEGQRWEKIAALTRGTVIEGYTVWSWKVCTSDYENGIPEEMTCVNENQFEGSLEVLRIENVGKRGTVMRAWYDFAHTIKEGDYVLLRDCQKNAIAAIGRFTGPYRYEPKRKKGKSVRSIEWLSTRLIQSPVNIGLGNTSPMPFDDPRILEPHITIIEGELNR